jgi:hypothetical protein
MGIEEYSNLMGLMKNARKMFMGKPEGRLIHLEEFGIVGRIILKWVLMI